MLTALETLYKKKAVDSNIGELGRVLLIHGLYRRTWEVASYHRDSLSNWIPSAPGTRAPSPAASGVEAWLPGNPVFSKWRNSACDCLDILHWSANSLVASRAGLEHPTVLHLHLARLILLTPATTIQNLASTILHHAKRGTIPPNSSESQYYKDRSEVIRWFIQDEYKARLAIVHAGAMFWHVRRYSHDNMLEPFAVFLATLITWAYSTSSQTVKHQREQEQVEQETPEEIDSPFINLDRLCDDELIQTFVLHGTRMTGFMAGIGDICQIGSSPKILREGAKILAGSGSHHGARSEVAIPTWGVAAKNAVFLEELANFSDRRVGQT
jgi:hypothetical protein